MVNRSGVLGVFRDVYIALISIKYILSERAKKIYKIWVGRSNVRVLFLDARMRTSAFKKSDFDLCRRPCSLRP